MNMMIDHEGYILIQTYESDGDDYIYAIQMVKERFEFGSFNVVNLDVIPGTYSKEIDKSVRVRGIKQYE